MRGQQTNLSKYRKGGATEAIIQRTVPSKQQHDVSPLFRSTQAAEQGLAEDAGEVEVSFPLQLRITAAKGGQPDLQLTLLTFSSGTETQRLREQAAKVPAVPPSLQGVADFAGKAAAIGFLHIAFPGKAPAAERLLARVGTVTALGSVAAVGMRRAGRGGLVDSMARPGQAAWARIERWKRRVPPRLQAVPGKVEAGGRACLRYAAPAAMLAAGAFLWGQLHPTSHQLMQAILVAIELSSGYAETKRKAARGAIRAGPELEAAWRQRHKWAARKAGRVMTDTYDSPPLQPFLSAAQRLSIGFLMLLEDPAGARGLQGGQMNMGVGAGRSAPGGDSRWLLNLSYPAGRSGGGQQEGGGTAAGLAAAAPVDTGSAGAHNPAQPARVHPSPGTPGPPGGGVTPGDVANELPEYFQPLPAEDLKTGALPTICSYEDMQAYLRQQAQPAGGGTGMATPFANGGAQTEGELGEVELFTTEELVGMDPGINQPGGHNQRDELLEGQNLALYGRADHSQQQPLTLLDKQKMGIRAVFLVAVFLPFLMLGPLLILLSARMQSQPQPAVVSRRRESQELIGEAIGGEIEAEEALPPSGMRNTAYRLLLWGIKNGGAAFIKWGQWSATREDMFPPELCHVLAELHDQAPVHSWRESKREIEAAFGRSVEELFESIEHKPLASGSIAQVHKAIMVVGGKRRSVVVKVRHPGVEVRIKQDFQILKPLAAAASQFKALKGLSLKESLAQFSSTMTAQTDLRVEAAHLRRFFRNFASVRASVTPPFPLPDYISEAVLIETFEPGQSVAKYIRNPAPFNTQVVALGVDTYLKMLLTDNFVHTDLHPGNILVRRTDNASLSDTQSAEEVRGQLQLILLDFGLAEELTPSVRHHFISFLHMIALGDGRRAAGHILKWSSNQSCPDPLGFTAAMVAMFKLEARIEAPGGIELDKVMKEVLRIARQFEVSIDSSYAALVIGVVVLVGFATSMDPAVNLMDAAAPAFLQNNLLGKVSGRLYS